MVDPVTYQDFLQWLFFAKSVSSKSFTDGSVQQTVCLVILSYSIKCCYEYFIYTELWMETGEVMKHQVKTPKVKCAKYIHFKSGEIHVQVQ